MELVLFYTVVEPIETHVDGLGSILSHGGVSNAVGRAIVSSNGGGRLWRTKFCKCHFNWYDELGVHVACSDFGSGG